MKKRHGFVTVWLVFGIIASIGNAIYLLVNADEMGNSNPIITFILSAFLVICYIALLNWKKWGFFGFIGTAVVSTFVNFVTGTANLFTVFFVIFGIAVLYLILQLKGEGVKAWDNLE
jgi:hypothetical protein